MKINLKAVREKAHIIERNNDKHDSRFLAHSGDSGTTSKDQKGKKPVSYEFYLVKISFKTGR